MASEPSKIGMFELGKFPRSSWQVPVGDFDDEDDKDDENDEDDEDDEDNEDGEDEHGAEDEKDAEDKDAQSSAKPQAELSSDL